MLQGEWRLFPGDPADLESILGNPGRPDRFPGILHCDPQLLESVELKILSFETALLTSLTSIKRLGDLQAYSVDET